MNPGALLAAFAGVCTFRRGPEDMPYSPALLIALLIGCGAVQAAFSLHNGAKPGAVAAVLIGGVAVVGTLYGMLRVRDRRERFVQTATALAAVYLVMFLVAVLLAWRMPLRELSDQLFQHPGHPPELTGAQSFVMFLFAVLGIWRICVYVSVLRRALEATLPGAILGLLMLFMVNLFVMGLAAAAVGSA